MRYSLRSLIILMVLAPAVLFMLWLLLQLGHEINLIVEPYPRDP
jgi:hypothetical protein